MKTKPQYPDRLLKLLEGSMGLRIRAGSARHRFIGIWHVVVNDRVFVRSWSVKEDGWYRTLLKNPLGAIEVRKRRATVVGQRARDKTLRDAIDRAYLAKYKTPGALRYAKDLCSAKSRATTLELVFRESPGA